MTIRLSGKDVKFQDLVQFVQFASEAANDVVYGRSALRRSADSGKPFNQRLNSSSFITEVELEEEEPVERPKHADKKGVCHLCKKSHILDDCPAYLQKSLDDRRAYVKENGLCFACYGYNHTSRGCLRRRKCNKCGKRHPTALHDDHFQRYPDSQIPNEHKKENDATISNAYITSASNCSDVILQAILPVKVGQEGGEKVLCTYAFYDSGSTGCFITEDLKHKLEAKSTPSTLKLQTMHGANYIETSAVNDLIVTGLNDENPIKLPKTFSKQDIPVSHLQIPRPELVRKWQHLEDISCKIAPYNADFDIGLLIGSNCPLALQPLQVVPTEGNGPFATLFRHGWTINGPLHVTISDDNNITCHRIMFQETGSMRECVINMFERDFSEHDVGKVPDEKGQSQDDKKFIDIVSCGMKVINGHYEIPLPFKESKVVMKNNYNQAAKRALWQRKKMGRDEKYSKDYTAFVENLIDKGYAYQVPMDQIQCSNPRWYLPHHAVYHPKKPDKIRVVFDCSAKFDGESLNDKLLQGPDMTNSLVGVLQRFREDRVAFMADIEAMFYQVRIPEYQHDFVRFLWWPEGKRNEPMQEYRMAVHIFGAISSPSVANFALKAAADKADESFGLEVAETIRKNFYVDDCLKSVSDEQTAIKLIKGLVSATSAGGFRLTKFASNSKEVLKSIPVQERSKDLQCCNLDYDNLINERALGMQWNMQSDNFGFAIKLMKKPHTRRGILSIISSLYDPLGFLSPFILPAKKMLQKLCQQKSLGWDDEIEDEYKEVWMQWMDDVVLLKELVIPRCWIPTEFGKVKSRQLHAFSDASSTGYGVAVYLCLVNEDDRIHTALLMGKARVSPIKATTIPRLELTAATVAVKLTQQVKNELEIDLDSITYHTDSTTVLHYIKNEHKRFPIFVANRVKTIRDFSSKEQWKYVHTKNNPADIASCGLMVQRFYRKMNHHGLPHKCQPY